MIIASVKSLCIWWGVWALGTLLAAIAANYYSIDAVKTGLMITACYALIDILAKAIRHFQSNV